MEHACDIARQRFIEANLTQGELSRRSGVSKPALSRWLSGTGCLSLKSLDAVLRALGLNVTVTTAQE